MRSSAFVQVQQKGEVSVGHQRGGAANGWNGLAVQVERRGPLALVMPTSPPPRLGKSLLRTCPSITIGDTVPLVVDGWPLMALL